MVYVGCGSYTLRQEAFDQVGPELLVYQRRCHAIRGL